MAKTKFEFSTVGHDEWLTPKWITDAIGPFDLDPCSPINRPWQTAKTHLNKNDDGLSARWEGFVWMNPPYGKEAKHWMKKLQEHENGVALIFVRTETKLFFESVWGKASAIVFLKGRIPFCYVDGTQAKPAGAPSCLISYGELGKERLKLAFESGKIKGHLILFK